MKSRLEEIAKKEGEKEKRVGKININGEW